MVTFAAVDIGANSVRLKIARLRNNRLVELADDREVVRLGESVFRSGLLDPKAMAQTVKVLQRFHREAQEHGATMVRVVATSSLRDARNSSAFIEWVESATGWRVEVISGLEEGRLIHFGVMTNAPVHADRVLLMDLGGGSCEITVSVARQITDIVSLPLGAVRLTREFLQHDPPKKKELEQLRAFIAEEVGRVERRMKRAGAQVAIATSGTAAALAGLYAARADVESSTVPRNIVVQLAAKLSKAGLDQRRAMPGIGPRRAEIIIAGANVYSELLTRLGLTSFRYLPLGLRDGVLAQMVADHDRRTRVRRQVESEREHSLRELEDRYTVDRRFAERARKNAVELFQRLKPIHGLPSEYEEWIAAAALLHEIGSYINRAGRHRHAYYLIAHSEIFGFTTHQREVVAAIARFMGRSRPTMSHRVVRVLPETDRQHVVRAVAILRLALALDQGRAGAITGFRTRVHPAEVELLLKAKRGAGDLEMWAVEKERGYFRAVFGRDLSVALD
jgi:exopolyphosphatase / guanosine-5'-triphosphate,3'-diphosphate pyrophosphatase